MRKPYRRQRASRGAIISWLIAGGVVFLFMAALSVMMLVHLPGIADKLDWPLATIIASFAALVLIGGIEALVSLPPYAFRPSADAILEADSDSHRPKKFAPTVRRSNWIAVRYLFWAAAGTAMMAGGIGAIMNPSGWSEDASWIAAIGAAICSLCLYLAFKHLAKPTAPKSLVIDRQGIHVSGAKQRFVTWPSINLINVDHDRHLQHFPETHWVELYGKRSQELPKRIYQIGWGKWMRKFYFARPLLRIMPRKEFGVSPTIILDALDSFRPPTVPIHDPLRIVDEAPS